MTKKMMFDEYVKEVAADAALDVPFDAASLARISGEEYESYQPPEFIWPRRTARSPANQTDVARSGQSPAPTLRPKGLGPI